MCVYIQYTREAFLNFLDLNTLYEVMYCQGDNPVSSVFITIIFETMLKFVLYPYQMFPTLAPSTSYILSIIFF